VGRDAPATSSISQAGTGRWKGETVIRVRPFADDSAGQEPFVDHAHRGFVASTKRGPVRPADR